MDDRIELLRQRLVLNRSHLRDGCSAKQAALYLMQIQKDEAELKSIANRGQPMAANIAPASLRLRAIQYRELADKADDPHLAGICLELAEMFDKDAEEKERGNDT
jgi:hypothetical protein